MRPGRAPLVAFLVAVLAVAVHAHGDGGFTVSRRAAGGGGKSSGGTYAVSGTIGAVDAVPPATGGSYALRGGLWPRASSEVCDDCSDDDGNGLVDRLDPGCAPLADGGGAGIAVRGPALAACRKAIDAAGLRHVADVQKRLAACTGAVFGCVQRKFGDARCLARARASCEKVGTLAAATAKLADAVTAACGAIAVDDLRAAAGLGYGGEDATCRAIGVGALDSAARVVACVTAKHGCDAVRAFARAAPRARELLALGAVDPLLVACLEPRADGGGVGLGSAVGGRLVAACQKALTAANAKLVTTTLRSIQRCTGAVFACVQKKPGDERCRARARTTCAKDAAPLFAGSAKAIGAFEAKVARACAGVASAALLDTVGLGFGSLAGECARLEVAPLTGAADVARCLVRHDVCRTRQLARIEAPRTRELLRIGGVTEP